ncbi:hypothetical protein [Mesorhizobium sp. M0174]|uniref:hypothetical protein n=1 Tax=Mesorhizobium sp. M0174 TaxID=2956904 RepID=UPI003337EB1A
MTWIGSGVSDHQGPASYRQRVGRSTTLERAIAETLVAGSSSTRAISALPDMLWRPRSRKRHDRQWRIAEFRDGYFFNQRVEGLVDASARFIRAVEAVLCAFQKFACRGEITSHDNTLWFLARRTAIVGALN